ncbi:hypothetical protein V8F06_009111 [Rhypophila decipiens]
MDIPTRVYRTFNDEIFGPPDVLARPRDNQFKRFRHLPTELRLLVWKKCLPESTGRLVSLLVTQSGKAPVQEDELFTVKNGLENVVSGYPYLLIGSQDHGQSCNALSQVNKEAREVFLAKYRLPVEICTEPGDRAYRFSTLRIDPDNDVVELTRMPSTTSSKGAKASVLLYVLHDMLANDPRGQGIAQLAMGADCNDVAHLAALQREDIHPVVLESISNYFSSHLKTFYSVIAPSSEARVMLGQFSFLHGPYHNNRSVPINRVQRTAEFTLLAEDPRPIQTDLPHVAVGTDPRMNVYLFYHVLAKFANPNPNHIPDPAPPMQIRYMMGIQLRAWEKYERDNQIVLTRAKFVDDLQMLDQSLIKCMKQFAPKHMPSYGQVFASEEEYERSLRGLADVSGLWVFDSDTFGDIGYDLTKELPGSDVRWRRTGAGYSPYKPKMVVDLSKGKRPGLMVFRFAGAGDGT